MSTNPSQGGEEVGSAELVAALCLATELGMGFPFEHGLHSTLIAARLADRLGVDTSTASQAYYACLLSHAGCTADAHVTAEVYGDSLTTHLHPVLYGSARDVLSGLLSSLPQPSAGFRSRSMPASTTSPIRSSGPTSGRASCRSRLRRAGASRAIGHPWFCACFAARWSSR